MHEESAFDHTSEFEKALNEEKKKHKKPVILVCGYTGSGKTSLIQAICGRDVVSDDKIVHGKPGTMDYLEYDSDLITFWDSQGFEPGQTEEDFINKTREFVSGVQKDSNVDNHIHLVWYAIQGSGARVTECDLQLIKNIFGNVIVVITKADITKPVQMEGIKNTLCENGVREDRILPVSDDDRASQLRLVDLTHDLLPQAYRDAFMSAQIVDLERKQQKAQQIIHVASVAAAGVGLIPIPLSDTLAITGGQLAMIASLAYLYGIPAGMAKTSLAPLVARFVGIATASSLTKLIPGLGSLINAAVAFGLTQAMGQMTNNYLISCAKSRIANAPMPDFILDSDMLRDMATSGAKGYRG